MPAAIQFPVLFLARMRSVGVGQVAGTAGESVSVNLKSPSAASGWDPELCPSGAVSSAQKSVAATSFTPPAVPIALLPARTKPLPSAVILPFVLTLALNCLITQGWPPGGTPRTSLRRTKQVVGSWPQVTPSAVRTPIPPSNSTRVSALTVGASIRTPKKTGTDTIHTLLMVSPP